MGITKFEDVCVKDRILLHLNKYSNTEIGQEYNVPFDITQDGIGIVVGISRAHASLSLKQLADKGMVACWHARMKGQKGKRLVYGILSSGKDRASQVESEMIAAGLSVDALMDMKRCDPQVKWESLSEEDRDTFGKACVIRIAIPRADLPETRTGILPTDMQGKVCIPYLAAMAFVKNAPEEKVKMWHSWAADWWIGSGNLQERLYHLVGAGRFLEACRLVSLCTNALCNNPNEDLLNILDDIPSPVKYEGDLLWVKCEISIALRRFEHAKRMTDKLGKYSEERKYIVLAQLAFVQNDYKSAYAYAEKSETTKRDILASIIMSHCFLRMGDLDSAEALITELSMTIYGSSYGYEVDRIFELKAFLAYYRNDKKKCVKYLFDAWYTAPDYRKPQYQKTLARIECGDDLEP